MAQASATRVAASRTAALPVSVRRNRRSGVYRFCVHTVRGENRAAVPPGSVTPGFSRAPLQHTTQTLWPGPFFSGIYTQRAGRSSGRIATGPGHLSGPGRLLEGDFYVLCGLAVLAGTALVLIRERAPRVARTLPTPPLRRAAWLACQKAPDGTGISAMA